MMQADAGGVHSIVPLGSDELGMVGALQASRVERVECKTIDAFSLAKAEICRGGYRATEKLSGTKEGEKDGREDMVPFFPEWTGYLGKAWKSGKSKVTAITNRKDPIFYSQLAASCDGEFIGFDFSETYFYELAARLVLGWVIDVHCPFDIYSMDDVMWAIMSRTEPATDYLRGAVGSRGVAA